MTPGRPSIAPILGVNFVGTLGFSIVLPFLVFLVTRWGGNAFLYGVMGATYSTFQLVGAPILGRWSDVWGRRRILLVSQVGTLVSWLVFLAAFAIPAEPLLDVDSPVLGRFALTLPLVVLFVARALDGLTGGNISVANAYLADVTPEEDRSANFGRMAVSANLGFILGPAIAGLLGATALGELLPVLAAVAISVVATWLIVFRLPESNPCVLASDPEPVTAHEVLRLDHKECFEMPDAERRSLADVLRMEGVPLVLSLHFLVMLGFNFFYVAFPMHAAEGLRWTVRETGIFFSVLSGFMVVAQGPVLSFAARRWSDARLALAGSLVLAVGFPLLGGSRTSTIYAGAALLALGNGIMWPSLVAVLSKVAGGRSQGAVQGVAGSAGAVASIVGLLAGGILFARLGASVFVVSGGVIAAVFLLSLRLPRA